MGRLAPLTPDEMTDEQRRVHDEFASAHAHGGGVRLTHLTWLRSPELAHQIANFGSYLRYRALPRRQRELAILITGRACNAPIEWCDHLPYAREEDIEPDIIDALRVRRRPSFARPADEIVFDAATELLERHALGDATYATAVERLGANGLVELIALVGYYEMMAMLIGAFQFQLPEGVEPWFTEGDS